MADRFFIRNIIKLYAIVIPGSAVDLPIEEVIIRNYPKNSSDRDSKCRRNGGGDMITSYLKGKKILAVDDEMDVLDIIEDILYDTRVDIANNYQDALRKICEGSLPENCCFPNWVIISTSDSDRDGRRGTRIFGKNLTGPIRSARAFN